MNDLYQCVFLNNKHYFDYTISRQDGKAFIIFNKNLSAGDTVIIKTSSATPKNANGYYEFPINLEHNPNNVNLETFTLGEVNDHVFSMIEDLTNFKGVFGNSNLGSLGDNSILLVKNLCNTPDPINNSLYPITTKDANVIKAIDFAKNEYRTFKRSFFANCRKFRF